MTIVNKLQNFEWNSYLINSLLKGTFIKTKKDEKTFERRRYGIDFENRKGKLFFKPLNLEVVPSDKPSEIRAKLEELYEKPEALGKGQNQFHQYVLQHYLGIKRADVIAFLKTKPEYQLRQDKKRIVATGIQATRPFQYWCCDLVDMNPYVKIRSNKNYRYIFSCLDIFTKFCWFIPIKHKEAKDTLAAFKKILNYNLRFKPANERNNFNFPAYLASDQGGEFKSDLETYLNQNGVIHKTTKSYTPQPNIENLNSQLRAMMRANFIKTNTLNWYDFCQDFADSKNTNRDGSTGKTPLDLMKEYFANNEPLIQEVAQKVRTKNEERFNRYYKQEDFQIGDHIRVKMSSFQSTLRQKEKEGTKKYVVVRFSPQIYQIQTIVPVPAGQFGYPKDSQNRSIRLKNGKPRAFNSGELLKISSNTPTGHVIDLTRANYLNRNKDGEDLYYEPPARQEAVPPPPPPAQNVIKLPKTGKEWTAALKGKEFTDVDNIRYYISEVLFDSELQSWVVVFVKVGEDNIARNREIQSFKDILEVCLGEDWYTPYIEEFFSKRK